MATTDRIEGADARAERSTGPALLAAGGILAAIGASTCCVLPLVFFALGVGGAWIGNLTALAPYQPIFVAAAVACLAFGFVRVYRRPNACADDEGCARPLPNRAVKLSLWLAAALLVTAILFPYAAPLILSA
ncbi:MAG: mercury transporter MerT [Methylobacterium sp.]|uniref:mercuric transporter MerT family protein n=1 Tax=Methylobacterium sp. TaxID=409 RepID=UPI00259118FD|nr:mercuric transporter MerT family protein [Methylobacterium sp.]MBY0295438.1 mercury transporter MerT [Methylobacterium sp.]